MKINQYLLCLLLSLMATKALADLPADPCAGSSPLLNLVNRPTVSDSACTVPFEKDIIEAGAQYQKLKGGAKAYNLPEAELRLGLPAKTELTLTLPNYNHQTQVPHSGLSASVVGLKHELWYNARWVTTLEGLVTLPTGSTAYGSNATGGTINGIVNYSLSNTLALLFMLGVSTQTLPSDQGGGRYNTVNPDLVLTWQFKEKWQTYVEAYGQSKTAPNSGAGFNADVGLQYLWTQSLATDVEVGQRISGKLGQFNNYVGAGLAILF